MEEMSDSNVIVSGSGTAKDPYIYSFRTTSQSYGTPVMFYAVIIVIGLVAVAGFLLGFYFGKRRKHSD